MVKCGYDRLMDLKNHPPINMPDLPEQIDLVIETRRQKRREKRYPKVRQETDYPFTWKLDNYPVLFDQATNRYWMRADGDGDWVSCTAFGLAPEVQQRGQRRNVLFAGRLAGYHEGWWAISQDLEVP